MSLRIGVIGLGMALKPHLDSLIELEQEGRLTIAGAFAPSPARRGAFAATYPQIAVLDDLDAVIARADALLILTPPFTHLDLVEKAARCGKHVLLEKPLDVTVERARRSVAVMAAARLTFGIVFQHRFREASRRLAALVAEEALGRLVSGSAAIRWWRPPAYFAEPGRGLKARDGGGVLLTQAIHTLDLFQSLTLPIIEVSAMAITSPLRAIDTEDVVAAAIRFANGAIGTIDATTVAFPGFAERIELAGEKATAVLEAERLEVWFKDGRRLSHAGSTAGGGGADPMAFKHNAHKALITDFVEAVASGREPGASGARALAVQRLIEALLRSAESRRPVEVVA